MPRPRETIEGGDFSLAANARRVSSGSAGGADGSASKRTLQSGAVARLSANMPFSTAAAYAAQRMLMDITLAPFDALHLPTQTLVNKYNMDKGDARALTAQKACCYSLTLPPPLLPTFFPPLSPQTRSVIFLSLPIAWD